MSRAYQIKVNEKTNKVICAEDHVKTELELLAILPAEQMGELLGKELEKAGYQRQGNQAKKIEGDISIVVELDSGTVTVQAESSKNVTIEGSKTGVYYDDVGKGKKATEKQLEKELEGELKAAEAGKKSELQKQMTEQLEGKLCDVRSELDQAVNRTTAEALKQKAAQLGQIKEMNEDPESGSLTIVIEV